MKPLTILNVLSLLAATAIAMLPCSAIAGVHLGLGATYASSDDLDSAAGLDIEAGWTSRGEWTGTFGANLQVYSFDGSEDLGLGDLADELERFGLGRNDLSIDADVSATPLMAFYRLAIPFGQGSPLHFYGEAGLGAVRYAADISTLGVDFDEDSWALAWAVGAGLAWDLTQNFGIRAGYQLLNLGDYEVDGQSFGLDALQVFRVGGYLIF